MATIYQNGIQYSGSGEPLIYDDMGGATSTTGGVHGLVPAPSVGDNEKFLSGDGSWKSAGEYITKTAEGNPIEITDGASAPMVKCVTEIQGSQDLHGYDKPWVGGAGKNKCNTDGTDTNNGYVYGQFVSYGGSYSGAGTYDGFVTEYFSVIPNTTYTLSGISGGAPSICFYDNTKSFISGEKYDNRTSFSITTPSNAVYCRMSVGDLRKDTAQIEIGSSPTSYEPYSNICPITAYTEGEILEGGNEYNGADNFTVFNSGTSIVVQANNKRLTAKGVAVNNGDLVLVKYNNSLFKLSSMFYYDNPTITVGLIANNQIISIESTSGEYKFNATNDGYVYFYFVPNEDRNVSPSELSDSIVCVMKTTHTTTYPSAIYRGSEDVVNGEVSANKIVWTRNSSTMNNSELYPGWRDSGIRAILGSGINNSYQNSITSVGSVFSVNTLNSLDILFLSTEYYGLSQADWIALAVDVQIVIDLPTATIEQVTVSNLPIKSLSGYTHIESSTGDMEVEYITEEYQPLVDLIEANSGKHVYSTDEQVVGTWIDGKTVYEKTFDLSSSVTISRNDWTSTGVASGDIGAILDANAYSENGVRWGGVSARVDNSLIKMETCRNSNDGDISVKTFTLQYTKTT